VINELQSRTYFTARFIVGKNGQSDRVIVQQTSLW